MTGPTTTNTTANAIDAVVQAGGGAIVQMAETLIIAAQPWLGLPGVKQIWEALFAWVASYFVAAAATGATFAVIDIQVGTEETKLSEALKALIAAEKTGDQNAIALAIKAYANANSALVNDDGSSTAPPPPTS